MRLHCLVARGAVNDRVGVLHSSLQLRVGSREIDCVAHCILAVVRRICHLDSTGQSELALHSGAGRTQNTAEAAAGLQPVAVHFRVSSLKMVHICYLPVRIRENYGLGVRARSPCDLMSSYIGRGVRGVAKRSPKF